MLSIPTQLFTCEFVNFEEWLLTNAVFQYLTQCLEPTKLSTDYI